MRESVTPRRREWGHSEEGAGWARPGRGERVGCGMLVRVVAIGQGVRAERLRAAVGAQRAWWRRHGPESLRHVGRLTAAAAIAYVIAHAIFPQTQPLTGPLTALLVVQATLFSTLRMGVQRVVSVVSGVLLAVLLSEVFTLTWWTLALAIGVALVVGLVLRLDEQLLEAPISAMLILGVPAAGPERVAETLVGAGVGMAFNVVFPPAVRGRDAARAVLDVSEQVADVLAAAARELPEQPSEEQALRWLRDVKHLSHAVDSADRALADFGRSRRLNPRAARAADTGPILRSGLDALEHSIVALRAMFRALAQGLRAEEEEPLGTSPALYGAVGTLLDELARSFRAYGALVVAEADPRSEVPESTLAEALDALREVRAFLSELLVVGAASSQDNWMSGGTLLGAVNRILAELDVEERARQRERWQRATEERNARRPVVRLREASRAAAGRRRRGGRFRG